MIYFLIFSTILFNISYFSVKDICFYNYNLSITIFYRNKAPMSIQKYKIFYLVKSSNLEPFFVDGLECPDTTIINY